MLATSLIVPTASGCTSARSLDKVEIPTAGVELGYDLSPGQSYLGHVRRSNTVQSSYGNLTQSIEFDVDMVVRGEDREHGGTLLLARFSNVDLKWQLPPGSPVSLNEFLAQTTAAIQGMEVRFNVDPQGNIVFIPAVPNDVPAEVGAAIQEVLDALETAFLTVPVRRLKQGETWIDREKRGRKGKLGRYLEGEVQSTLEGMYRDPNTREDLAKIVIREQKIESITTKEGSHENSFEGKTEAMFSTSGRYLSSIDGQVRKHDPGVGVTFSKVNVRWSKRQRDQIDPVAPAGEVQAISDPCHADYVGAQECTETPREGAEATPTGDAPPSRSPPE